MTEEPDPQKHPFLPDYSKALLDQLTSEYRIIQDKIDKIAGFRFTIRGWSVTLVVAFGFGANTLKLPPYWITAAFLPLVAFLLMERSQVRNHDTLCMRALRIEKRIWRVLRLSAPADAEVIIGGMVPRLAHELGEQHRSIKPAVRWFGSIGYILFYAAQMLLVLFAAAWVSQFHGQALGNDEHLSQVIRIDLSPERTGSAGGKAYGKAEVVRREP